MIALRQEAERYILEFSKTDVSEEFLLKLLNKYKVDQILEKNEMTEADAWNLSEEIKKNWFNENQKNILKKIGVTEDESNR